MMERILFTSGPFLAAGKDLLTAPELLWRVPDDSGCAGSGGVFKGTSPTSLQISSGALFPFSALPDGISGDPAAWTGASEWGLFKEGHVAPQRNDKADRVRSKAGIGWLWSQEPGRGQEVWQKGIWGLSPSWKHHFPRQELSLGG